MIKRQLENDGGQKLFNNNTDANIIRRQYVYIQITRIIIRVIIIITIIIIIIIIIIITQKPINDIRSHKACLH